jgi:two-component system, OmpR family, phosphate regulon sensor histidine kinase PhoR
MKKPIFIKLFASYLLLIIALSAIILSIVFRSFSSHVTDTTAEGLRKLGLSLQYTIKPFLEQGRIHDLESAVRQIEADIHVRVTVIDSQGTVLADSEHSPETMENHMNRPEVRAALSGTMGRSIRYSTTLKRDMLYVALPMKSGVKTEAVIRTSIPLENIDPLLFTVKRHTLELVSIIVLSSLLVALLFTHALSARIRSLYKASKRLAGGDFSARVSLQGEDEIEELAGSFNEMAERLERYFSELTRSKEELEGIISSMDEGLLVLDSQGRIMLANRSVNAITGTDNTAGRYYWELIRSPRLNSLFDMAAQGSLTDEIELGEKTYLCSITPIHSGKDRIILLHDITEMKRIETIKRDLAVNVSHELRTPLTAIKGFTETMIDEGESGKLEYLEIIRRHTDRLINIINDLLDLSEMEASGMKIAAEDVRLKPLIESVLLMFDRKLKDKGLKASLEETSGDVVVKGDPFRLEQLFTNLIDNAIKYTEEGGITVTIESDRQNAVISITDTGIGIPKEHIERIFERFYVVDKSRSRKLGGTGLGLSIVKHITNLHKGSIAVSSRPYSGTTFTVTLPRA